MTEQETKDFSGLKPSFFKFIGHINTSLDSLMDNSVLRTAIIIFLVFYAAFAAPNLPNSLKQSLKTKNTGTIIRIIFAFAIILLAGNVKTLSLALLLAIGLVITLQNLEDKSSDVTINDESNSGSWIKEDGINTNKENQSNLEKIENFQAYENKEYFNVIGSPFMPVEESGGETNRPRHLPHHAVNKQIGSNADVNGDGIYNDDYTQATNSLLTFNLKQNSFTDEGQLNEVQSNNIPGVDQHSGIQRMNPQQGPQGLKEPIGYND